MGAYLVLVGLVYLCEISFSQGNTNLTNTPECVRELHENVDFPGTDLTYVYSPDADHCQLLCTQHPSCLFFTFIRHDWTRDKRHFYCYLKSTSSGKPNVQTPLLGVTSGYSLKPCNPETNICLSSVYHNVDFHGADFRSLFTADYEECQRACTHDPACQFFTFANELIAAEDIRYKCHLKFSWTVPRLPIIESTAGVVSGFSDRLQANTQFYSTCKTVLLGNTDIPGNDFETVLAASADHCLALCSVHPSCTYFSYFANHKSKRFHCYLKNNQNVMAVRAEEGVTSGIPARFCQPDNTWVTVAYEETDFRASDIRFELLDDLETCRKTCNDDPNCQFYSYLNDAFHDSTYWRRCFLKRVITIPAPARVVKLPNVVSGFALKYCYGSTHADNAYVRSNKKI
ncbi:coagulation factor XI-like isoform 1-T2 [Polymixia lowei]